MNINWFPGHMKKTVEEIEKKSKLTDFYIEIVDARIPISSRNPLIGEILKDKKSLIILNKSDLSDPVQNEKWIKKLSSQNSNVILYDSTKPNVKKIEKASFDLLKDMVDKYEDKGIKLNTLRAMIVGIPNSGKSTFINGLIGKKVAKVGNKPGITKTNQWIKINNKLHLLDTPGILWHKFEKEETALSLAYTGAIRDEILDVESLALKFIEKLIEIDPKILEDRYKIETDSKKPLEILEEIALKRGAILKNNIIDYSKVANIIFDDFRKGKLGRITLETL
ncbi:ribosome biogenesis GTPase YlqF [Peptoniphilus obesi]|uniref:ribosome biogenesis GTPase YlqF n=1 Tax=Peptoniphilus obesi TaxID=1472765 RepID=UPI0004B37AA8|nr:ribosome biogenesis GTPase YlqF [Peptoniphilus obesi]